MANRTPPHAPSEDELRDLGFGSVVARESLQRLLNRDGSFNVGRRGLGLWASLNFFHWLLTLSWPWFIALVALAYLAVNALFAAAYLLAGPDALSGPGSGFARAFFFSVQTLGTIGYGQVAPASPAANLIVTIESIAGLLGIALAGGFGFARVSRPTARILFSRNAVVAPYGGGAAFMFRIANLRSSQIIELGAKLLFATFEPEDGRRIRRFYPLKLERERVVFFPLSWTIVHPIDEASPLAGLTAEDLWASDAEFLVLLTGTDETFSQVVHARSSYSPDEVVWSARFADIFDHPRAGEPLTVDVSRIHELEPLLEIPHDAT